MKRVISKLRNIRNQNTAQSRDTRLSTPRSRITSSYTRYTKLLKLILSLSSLLKWPWIRASPAWCRSQGAAQNSQTQLFEGDDSGTWQTASRPRQEKLISTWRFRRSCPFRASFVIPGEQMNKRNGDLQQCWPPSCSVCSEQCYSQFSRYKCDSDSRFNLALGVRFSEWSTSPTPLIIWNKWCSLVRKAMKMAASGDTALGVSTSRVLKLVELTSWKILYYIINWIDMRSSKLILFISPIF